MTSGLAVFRVLRNLTISNNLKYPSSRLILGINNKVFNRFCSTSEASSEKEIDPKDRSVKIPVETSIRYLKSRAYHGTYGNEPVWVPYRRNLKGHLPPKTTRRTCIKQDKIVTGNPCPICRDEYLVLHETNVDLLKQFISPFTGEILHYNVTSICRRQHDTLVVSILRARDQGLLTYDVPFRRYNYDDFKPKTQ
ncbi:28S ribosomal protein S18b, mitochondrial [Frankliniella occidentalis]|uniref:Small ribosomal subunit protein mS40 n=1 Tax=Frankliniella occidentalis TaxID=133901 RepID=A0A6J1TT27_FRAOC|nr:28S ribosomal protein S18b, mitochondrial [Frankliniella occidentalis]